MITRVRPDVLSVPVTALFRKGSDWAVYLAEGGKARLRRVGIGEIGEDYAEVTSGLEEGARVIVSPSDQVADNTAIAPGAETATVTPQ